MMKKAVFIINGNGGVGKDTLCDFAGKAFKSKIVSSITPIKDIARQCGWNGGKDKKSRKFLADLKQVCVEFNDLPTKYLIDEYNAFVKDDYEILFVHIRESTEIEKFKKRINSIPCITILIKRNSLSDDWGNEADDNVENYNYDYYYNNDLSLDEAEADFISFLRGVLTDRGII